MRIPLEFRGSSMVEYLAVNQGVAGSSPARGAILFRAVPQESRIIPVMMFEKIPESSCFVVLRRAAGARGGKEPAQDRKTHV